MTKTIKLETAKKIYETAKKYNYKLPESEYYFYDCYPKHQIGNSIVSQIKVLKGKNQKNTKTEERILMVFQAFTFDEFWNMLPPHIDPCPSEIWYDLAISKRSESGSVFYEDVYELYLAGGFSDNLLEAAAGCIIDLMKNEVL